MIELSETPTTKKRKRKPLHLEDPQAYIEEIMQTAFSELITTLIKPIAKKRQFRTSSLPFCPILSFLSQRENESYAKNHYTSIGTAMHSNIQSWLSVTGQSSKHMFGSWKCTSCSKLLLNIKRPNGPCKCLGSVSVSDMHRDWPKFWCYEEVEYKYRGLTGHIDLIMWPLPDFAFIVDFKTTNLMKKKSSHFWVEDKPSSPSYIVQIRTYCTVVDLTMDLPIKGWTLVNLDRGDPIQKPTDPHLITALWDHNKSLKWDKKIEQASQNDKLLVKLEQAIEDGLPKKSKRLLTDIIENRPCVSEATYKSWMHYKFFKGGCELKETCLTCSTNKILKTTLAKLKEVT